MNKQRKRRSNTFTLQLSVTSRYSFSSCVSFTDFSSARGNKGDGARAEGAEEKQEVQEHKGGTTRRMRNGEKARWCEQTTSRQEDKPETRSLKTREPARGRKKGLRFTSQRMFAIVSRLMKRAIADNRVPLPWSRYCG